MKMLLFIVGLVFVAAGIVIGVVSQTDYGNALIGLTPGLAATLLVGGFVVTGLAGVIGAVDRLGDDFPQSLPSGNVATMGTATGLDSRRKEPVSKEHGNKEHGNKDNMPFPAATAAVGASVGAAGMAIGSAFDNAGGGVEAAVDKVAEAAKEAKEKAANATENIADTVGDMADKAKDTSKSAVEKVADLAADAKGAVTDVADDTKEAITEVADDAGQAVAETVESATDAVDDTVVVPDTTVEDVNEQESGGDEEAAKGEDGEQLYIVEEIEIRGKAARVLSDNTVEAETDEGWMRFENIEHLEEYLEAMQA